MVFIHEIKYTNMNEEFVVIPLPPIYDVENIKTLQSFISDCIFVLCNFEMLINLRQLRFGYNLNRNIYI